MNPVAVGAANLCSPAQVRGLLAQLDFTPRKTLGQNFLISRHARDFIIAAAELPPAARVIEVGPGLGVLTEALLDCGAQVWAVEKDPRLAAYLRGRWGAAPGLHLEVGDALDLDWDALAEGGYAHLVSNLPYAAGCRILVEATARVRLPVCMVVTVQDEVAARMGAAAGTAAYGALSAWLQADYEIDVLRRLPPDLFVPRPRVDSAVVRLRRRPQSLVPPPHRGAYRRLIKLAFSARRKQIGPWLGRIETPARAQAALATAGIQPRARPETLAPADWARLVAALAGGPAAAE